MRVRLFTGLILALILNLVLAGAPSPSRLALSDCAPPAGLQVPAGQGLVVRCRLRGGTGPVRIRFSVDGIPHRTVDAPADGVVFWSWLPQRTGSHTLALAAYVDGRPTATVSRQVQVVPGGRPVRIP